jgi:hypothetical protein
VSSVGPAGRSFLRITRDDLERLGEIAADDRRRFFRADPNWARLYERRVVCTALCQGAVQHYMDGSTGIQDFDVYTFSAANPEHRWCDKRTKRIDFGDPKFGQSPDAPRFVGRRVDLIGHALSCARGAGPVLSIQAYLLKARTATARHLAAKPVVMLDPAEYLGQVAWPRA